MAKYSDKITWGYWPNIESHYALRNMERSITGEVLDNIFQHTNHSIFIIQTNFSRERDVKLTDKSEIKSFIGLLFLAGELRRNKQSLDELWGIDGDGSENIRLLMCQRRFKIQSDPFLNKLDLYQ